jgi:hypothetical protein
MHSLTVAVQKSHARPDGRASRTGKRSILSRLKRAPSLTAGAGRRRSRNIWAAPFGHGSISKRFKLSRLQDLLGRGGAA